MQAEKHVVIAGGTGFLGKALTHVLTQQGYEVYILTRSHQLDLDHVHHIKWDGASLGRWQDVLEGAEALINLNGKSVDCRYTETNKQLIYETRLSATRVLAEALSHTGKLPGVWLNASSATIYRHAEDRDMDEANGEIGVGFSVDVCEKWESIFFTTPAPDVRKVALRTGIVLGKKEGALQPLKRLTKAGLGGRQGNGNQYVSWIHEYDFVQAVLWLMHHEAANGAYNLTAPAPVKNRDFMKFLRKSLRVPLGMPLPVWSLKFGAHLIRTEPELILKSRRVVPARLLEEGFVFHFPDVTAALEDLIGDN